MQELALPEAVLEANLFCPQVPAVVGTQFPILVDHSGEIVSERLCHLVRDFICDGVAAEQPDHQFAQTVDVSPWPDVSAITDLRRCERRELGDDAFPGD